MIKPQDLRKGLYFNVPRKDQCPFRIDVIEHLSDNYAKVGMSSGMYKLGEFEMEGHPLTWELKDLEPIPLTEEWLLRMGFSRHHLNYSNGIIYILNVPNNTEFEWGVYPNMLGSGFQIHQRQMLAYVHTLQNIIHSLTGEELTIKP
jgi:hypothetical protein